MGKRKDPEARRKYKNAWAKHRAEELKAEEFARDPIAAAKKREGRTPDGTMLPVEQTDRDDVAEAIVVASDPGITNFNRAVRQTGLSPSMAKKIKGRLDRDLLPVKLAVEEVKTSQLLALTADRAQRILSSISQEDIDKAGLRDKAVAAAIFIEKRQLLSGEPTHLIGVQDRRHLGDLTKALMLEAQRRGITIDVSPIDGSTRCLDENTTEDGPAPLHWRGRRKIEP